MIGHTCSVPSQEGDTTEETVCLPSTFLKSSEMFCIALYVLDEAHSKAEHMEYFSFLHIGHDQATEAVCGDGASKERQLVVVEFSAFSVIQSHVRRWRSYV